MNWLTKTLTSSVGKKPLMAISGLFFCIFLMIHLCGNLTIYYGKENFNNYTNQLHSLGMLITIFEILMLFLGLVHISIATYVFLENMKARTKKYAIKKKSGGQTIASSTMPYTGCIMLIFIIVHLSNFHFVNKVDVSTFSILQNVFSESMYVLIYVLSISAVSIHISHGFWSAFQTMGIFHTKYNNLIKKTGFIISLIVSAGFGFIPIYIILAIF